MKNSLIKIPQSTWITTYQTNFGKDNEQELIIDFNALDGVVYVRVEELHTTNPYIQWFNTDGIDEAFQLVEDVKKCLTIS